MALLSNQRAAGLVGLTLFIFLLLGYTTYNSRAADTVPFDYQPGKQAAGTGAPTLSQPGPADGWAFDAKRDAKNFGLSPEQCDAAFPKLWAEIDRAVAHRKKVGNITPDEVKIGWKIDGIVRAMIYDRQLFILNARGARRRDYRQRTLAVLQSIQRAITAYPGDIPNIEFSFVVDDGAYFAVYNNETSATTWALTREPQDDNLWLMPDFGFYSWEGPAGEYSALLRAIAKDEMPFEQKDPRAIWRGAKAPAGHVQVRSDLLKVSKGKDWADIEEIVWGGEGEPKNLIPMSKHCKYMFPVHTEGHTYSGRLKYLLNCHSLTVIHKLHWLENFHNVLVSSGPEQNFIQVERDFSDMHWKMEYYLQHQDEAKRIADNNIRDFRDRYLTPAAQACYWRKLFWAWREVSFEPDYYMSEEELKLQTEAEKKKAKDKQKVDVKLDEDKSSKEKAKGKEETKNPDDEKRAASDKKLVPRGMPYETYLLLESYEESPWYNS
ncbi:Protein O-glucosyltransferase 1 [Lasiodiplodia hormozganensis]|uniref:Protein O-glucosyltransferase 1 n=1 Tax=Lasiodiplodia hormozganensis TaxID=869390 RepID=A0AA40CG52_9PEZI|nr:Protein O-glucosyltransferase 1 [Lasiodiplodia hormozganensis]